MLNGLDLFSGIGGLTLALEPWVRPIAYCEIERYATGVLLSRMAAGELPAAPIWDDVRTLHGNFIPEVDIVYGGFPCQDLSLAGARKGLDGERSGLFFEIVRLTNELRPTWVFLENVPGVKKFVPRIRAEFEALGYDCRDGFISAAEIGANHIRNRWFLLAYSKSQRTMRAPAQLCETNGRPVREVRRESFGAGSESGDLAHTEGGGRSERSQDARGGGEGASQEEERGGSAQPSWWAFEPNVGRVANGIPRRMDRLRGLGNAVVPLQAREAFKRLMGIHEKYASQTEGE